MIDIQIIRSSRGRSQFTSRRRAPVIPDPGPATYLSEPPPSSFVHFPASPRPPHTRLGPPSTLRLSPLASTPHTVSARPPRSSLPPLARQHPASRGVCLSVPRCGSDRGGRGQLESGPPNPLGLSRLRPAAGSLPPSRGRVIAAERLKRSRPGSLLSRSLGRLRTSLLVGELSGEGPDSRHPSRLR